MATFRKETFYTMRRLDDGSVGSVRVNGWTDGEYNYYSVKNPYSNLSTWFAIDKDSGLNVFSGTSRNEVRQKVLNNLDKINEYKKTERYNEQVMQFYRAKVKAGAIVFLNNN